jgi:hypothetical protein
VTLTWHTRRGRILRLHQQFIEWLARTRAGDIASIVGLFVTIVGFVITIYNVLRSRTAAQAAEAAAREARAGIRTQDSIVAITTAITAMDEVRRLHRDSAWALLPDRYSTLRNSLISIRSGAVKLSDEQLSVLQAAIQQFAGMERQVDQAIVDPEKAPDPVKLNQIVSKQSDRLIELLVQIRSSHEATYGK